MTEFFEIIMYGIFYIALGLAVFFVISYITLSLVTFIFKDDDIHATIVGIVFGVSSIAWVLAMMGFMKMGLVVLGYLFCFFWCFMYLILK